MLKILLKLFCYGNFNLEGDNKSEVKTSKNMAEVFHRNFRAIQEALTI